MRNHFVTTLGVFALTAFVSAQAPQSAAPQPFVAGTPLKQQPNVKTYGGFRFAASVSYDAERDLYVAVNGEPKGVRNAGRCRRAHVRCDPDR